MPRDTQLRQNGKPQLRVVSRPATPLGLALDMFITAKEAERCTPRTIETYSAMLVRFRNWLIAQGVRDPQAIIPHHIRLSLAELDKQGLSAGYIHIHAPVIETWVRFLHAEGIIPSDPMQKATMPRLDKTILPAFSTDDVKHLLDACEDERDRALDLEYRTRGSRIEVLLRLNENSAINELKSNWHIVKEALRRVSAWQGTAREDVTDPEARLLVSLHHKSYSYRIIAEIANEAIAYFLTKAVNEPQRATSWIWEVWARQLLHRLGLKEDDIDV